MDAVSDAPKAAGARRLIISIVGARPQFIKMAPVSRAVRRYFRELIIHTGQHYDREMSAVFFGELKIPTPDFDLGVGSGTHGAQTGEMLARIEKVLLDQKPDWVLVYGDTNSTLAGALAAAKLQIPVAHVEAGLRSFNRAMPEEINRVVTDHLSASLFCPTPVAQKNLAREGITRGVHHVGDVMAGLLLENTARAETQSKILARLSLKRGAYLLATVHRPANTDAPDALARILDAFAALDEIIVCPIHPRTRKALQTWNLRAPENVRLVDPVSYLDMLMLEKNARMILTDSGGVQKEAFFFQVPCITLRDESEWVETFESGFNTLVGADRRKFLSAVERLDKIRTKVASKPQGLALFGNGKASARIARILARRWR